MTIIAALGIIIASAALFIVLSGFAGLKSFSLEFSSFVDPDLRILPSQGKVFEINDTYLSKLKSIKGIEGISKTIEERVILEFDDKRKLATLKGVDRNYNYVTSIDSMVAYGSWFEEDTDQVVSGWGIANNLSLGVFDYAKSLKIYVPKPGKGQITSVRGAFNTVNATNVGVFQINEDIDNDYVFSNIETAKYLLRYTENQISALDLKLDNNIEEDEIRLEILNVLGDSVIIKNRAQLNDSLYKMLNTENIAVYLIFTLVIIIALFNVVGALIMMILDKKQSITTLYNLGTTIKSIKRIFFLQGGLMTIIGGLIGLILGLILVVNQIYGPNSLKIMITPSFPYPMELKLLNILIVLLTISVFGILAAKIASKRITKKLVKI
jgi:lipoprotein-releasing system permease protein